MAVSLSAIDTSEVIYVGVYARQPPYEQTNQVFFRRRDRNLCAFTK